MNSTQHRYNLVPEYKQQQTILARQAFSCYIDGFMNASVNCVLD